MAVLADHRDVRKDLLDHVGDPGGGGRVVEVHAEHVRLRLLSHLGGVLDVRDPARVNCIQTSLLHHYTNLETRFLFSLT